MLIVVAKENHVKADRLFSGANRPYTGVVEGCIRSNTDCANRCFTCKVKLVVVKGQAPSVLGL